MVTEPFQCGMLYDAINQPDTEIDLRLLIHQSLAGCVIGKGGGKIKEIRDVSKFNLLNTI